MKPRYGTAHLATRRSLPSGVMPVGARDYPVQVR
jgi:hypothetical protein